MIPAIMILCLCVLARTDRDRDICRLGVLLFGLTSLILEVLS